MSVRMVVPDSIFGGFYKSWNRISVGLLAHSLQCDQRWIFLISVKGRRFGYRTRGDATSKYLTYYDGGFHFPWQNRTVSGRG